MVWLATWRAMRLTNAPCWLPISWRICPTPFAKRAPARQTNSCASARLLSRMRRDCEFVTRSAEETIDFGRQLAPELAPPKLVLLQGDLGAGKTTLVKGIVEEYSVTRQEQVTSPTFTLIHEYRSPRADIYHIDLYRVDTPRQLETLAIDDLLGPRSLILVEWGEKFDRFRRESDVKILMERIGESERKISISHQKFTDYTITR